MNRRQMITSLVAATAVGSLEPIVLRAQHTGTAAGAPPKPAPAQVADPEPQVNDIEKYPRCNYCNMDRKQYHHSRMLIAYGDDTVDPLCSLRCAASSLTINLGRGAKAIWVGDNASAAEIKPLVDAERASYLIGSSIRGVMTRRSKVAYSARAAADASRTANGGDVADFDQALLAAYTDVAETVSANLKRRRPGSEAPPKEPRP